MADMFDADVAKLELAALVKSTGDDIRSSVGDTTLQPIFRTLVDGTVVDRNGQLIRGPIPPLELKGKQA